MGGGGLHLIDFNLDLPSRLWPFAYGSSCLGGKFQDPQLMSETLHDAEPGMYNFFLCILTYDKVLLINEMQFSFIISYYCELLSCKLKITIVTNNKVTIIKIHYTKSYVNVVSVSQNIFFKTEFCPSCPD